MPRGLRARLLGRLSVQIEGAAPAGPWQRPAARRLVQILLLRPSHSISRDALAELLFSELPPREAARAVSKALAMARSAFGAERGRVLAADRANVWLDESLVVETDLDERSRRLRAAIGRPVSPDRDRELEELLSDDREPVEEEPYADWVMPVRDAYRETLRQARLELARGRASGRAGTGPAALIAAWQACFASDPTDEEAAAGLLEAQLSLGQRDVAIRTFHRCRAALRDELDVEPGPRLLQLHEAAVTFTGGPRPDQRLAPRPSVSAPPLRGRGPLLLRLTRLMEAERTSALFLTGPPGIGKTRLLEALVPRLEKRGWTVMQATATPDDRRAPLAPLRSLLPGLLELAASPPPGSLEQLAAGPDGGPAENRDTARRDPRKLADDVRLALEAASSAAPLALLLDDAQWWDAATERLVAELTGRRRGGGWAMVIAARSGEPKAPPPQLPAAVVRVDLPPLSRRATEAVVGDTARGHGRLPGAIRSAIASRSAGNPFFAEELTRQAMDERDVEARATAPSRIPSRIVELLQARLRHCSATARLLLPIAALAAGHAGYELLIRVGHLLTPPRSPEDVIRALDELVAAELLVEGTAGVTLVHPLLMDATLSGINPVRRGALHAQIATALEEMGRGPGGAWQEAAARHRLSSFEFGRLPEMASAAAAAGFAAGHRARELLAREAAVELLRGAREAFAVLDDDQRAPLSGAAVAAAAELGDCLLDGEDDGGAREAYEWGLELAETDEQRGRLWSALGGISYRHGDMAGAALAYERGLAALGEAATRARALLLSDLGWARQRQGRHQESLRLFEQALPALEEAGDHANLAWTLDRLAIALVSDGQAAAALRASTRAFEAAARAGLRRELAALHIHRADVFEALGELPDALAQSREAARVSGETGDRYVEAVAHWETADILAALRQTAAALEERDRELSILEDLDNPRNLAGNQLHRAQLLAALGRREEARQAAAIARAAASRVGDPLLAERLEAGLAELEAPGGPPPVSPAPGSGPPPPPAARRPARLPRGAGAGPPPPRRRVPR